MSDQMQSDAERLAQAMKKSGHSDHFFVELFSVAQSTVSRLRAQKIHKVQKYIDQMVAEDVFYRDTTEELDSTMNALALAAKGNPELAEVLRAMGNFVHNSMR